MGTGRGRRRAAGRIAAVLVGIAAAGCASRRPATLIDRFVVQAGPDDAGPVFDIPGAASPAAREAGAPAETADLSAVAKGPVPKTAATVPRLETVDAALARAVAALEAAPGDVDALTAVADAYYRLGVYDLAEQALARAIRRRPTHAGLQDRMARVWRDWGRPDVALGHAWRAVYFAPASAEARNTLGTVLYALGQLDGARDAFRRAVTLDPGAEWARKNLCRLAAQSAAAGGSGGAEAGCGGGVRPDAPRSGIVR